MPVFSKEMPILQNGTDATIDYCMFMVMVDIKNHVIAANIAPVFTVKYIIGEKYVGRVQYISVTGIIKVEND